MTACDDHLALVDRHTTSRRLVGGGGAARRVSYPTRVCKLSDVAPHVALPVMLGRMLTEVEPCPPDVGIATLCAAALAYENAALHCSQRHGAHRAAAFAR